VCAWCAFVIRVSVHLARVIACVLLRVSVCGYVDTGVNTVLARLLVT
jgi:hypothetical protein